MILSVSIIGSIYLSHYRVRKDLWNMMVHGDHRDESIQLSCRIAKKMEANRCLYCRAISKSLCTDSEV